MKPYFISIITLFLSSANLAQATEKYGCQAATDFLAVAEIYAATETDGQSIVREMKLIKVKACNGEYTQNQSVYYSNGKGATSYAGTPDASWYWPNGKSITSYALRPDATVYFPNGKSISSYFRKLDATFYYANGKSITSYSGRKGASIYDPNGKTLVSNSPSFDLDGQLDVSSFLSYVSSLVDGSDSNPASCSASGIKTQLDEAIEFASAGLNNQAIDVIKRVKMCF